MTGVTVFMPLTKGYVTQVDWEDYDQKLRGTKWYASVSRRDGRVRLSAQRGIWRSGRTHIERLYRYLMAAGSGTFVDHINGNTLDNRSRNLRICSRSENRRNTGAAGISGLKGVHRRGAGWRAFIQCGGSLTLGSYATAEEAARAYDRAAILLYGAFARVNFPYPEMLAEGHVAA